MSLQRFHSILAQAVLVPVLSVLVKWPVVGDGFAPKSRKPSIFETPGHDEGPCNTGLRFEITIS